MTVPRSPAMAETLARVAAIQRLVAPPPGFAAALERARAAAPADGLSGAAAVGGGAGASSTTGVARPAAAPKVAATWTGQAVAATGTGQAVAAYAAGQAVAAYAAGQAGAPDWAARLPEAGRRWAGAIDVAAERAGIDPRLLAALVWAESGFRADARSHAGAVGLTQLMPGTARGLGVDPHDPVANLDGGARYLRAQLDRFGSVELALAAYNAGPGRVARAGAVPRIAETQAYVPRVLDYHARLR